MHTEINFTGALKNKNLNALTGKRAGTHQETRLWVVVCDSGQAHLYSRQNHALQPLGAATPHIPYEKVEDADIGRAGKGKNVIMSRSNYEETENSQRHEAHLFLRSLVDFLDKARQEKAFDRLILAAAPKTLGDLRNFMPASLQATIEMELARDLIHAPLPELTRLIGKEVQL